MNTRAKPPQIRPQIAATLFGTAKNANHKKPNTKTIKRPQNESLGDASANAGFAKWTLPNGRDTPKSVMSPPNTAMDLPRILPGESAQSRFRRPRAYMTRLASVGMIKKPRNTRNEFQKLIIS